MKTYRMLILCAIVSVPLCMSAEDAPAALNPKTLGQIEAIYDFCASVNPAIAKDKESVASSVSKASKEKLGEARTSDDYKEAYDATTASLNELPKDRVLEACHGAVTKK